MKKIISESDFKTLNDALSKQITIERLKIRIKERDDQNRLILLEVGKELVDDVDRTATPGFQISQETVIEFDEKTALAFAKDADMFPGAASLLTVRSDSVGVLIGLTMQFQNALLLLSVMPENEETARLKKLLGSVNLKSIFAVDKTGYKAAVRDEIFTDIPHTSKTERLTVKISANAVKTGTELREFLNVVPDNEAVTTS